jgi:hypothetical protein
MLLASVLIAAVLLGSPASAAEVTRSVMADPSTGDATITLTVQGLVDGGIAEVLPDGWQFKRSGEMGRVRNDGKTVAVRVRDSAPITYVVSTGGHPEGTVSGFWEDYATLTNGTVLGGAPGQGPAPVQTRTSPGFSTTVLLVSLGVTLCVLCMGRKEVVRP